MVLEIPIYLYKDDPFCLWLLGLRINSISPTPGFVVYRSLITSPYRQ